MILYWIFLYILIGIFTAMYVWQFDYQEEYEELKINDDAEDSLAVLFIMSMVVFWPIVIIYKTIKNYKL